MKLRAAFKRMIAAASALAILASPAAALAPSAPGGAVFIILPGGTATSATVAMQMPNGVPIPIGTLNPTTGVYTPAGVARGVMVLPSCAAGSTTAPVPTGQPFQCAGLIMIAQ